MPRIYDMIFEKETINKGDNGKVSFDLDELLKEIETDHDSDNEQSSQKKDVRNEKKDQKRISINPNITKGETKKNEEFKKRQRNDPQQQNVKKQKIIEKRTIQDTNTKGNNPRKDLEEKQFNNHEKGRVVEGGNKKGTEIQQQL